MSFEFNPALATDKDKVRFKIGDTTKTAAAVEDETIDALLNSGGSVINVSIEIVRALLARYARDPDKKLGPLEIEGADRGRNLERILDALIKERDHDGVPSIFSGGFSEAVRDLYDDDSDVIKLPVDIGMHDNTSN